MSVSTSIPIEGVLNCWNDEHDLPDLLLSISRAGRTGRLLFSNPEADKTLFVKAGRIVFAESSSEDDGLGQYLLRTSQISLMDYVRVSRRVERGKRLGVLLVEEGVLEPKALVPAVVGQVRAIILGLFRRTETWYRFKDEELSPKEAITLDMPISQLVLDGVQYVESWRRVSKGVGSLDSVYRRLAASAAEWGSFELNDGVSELLDLLKQPVSVDHICTHASLPDFDACRYIWAFRCLGWIESVEVAQPVVTTSGTKLDPAAVATMPSIPPEAELDKPEPPPVPETIAPPDPLAAEDERPARTPAIAQHLIETRVAMDRKDPVPAAQPPPPAAPPPRANIEALAKTQLDVDRKPSGEEPAQTRTAPEVEPPAPPPRKPIPKELVQTQLFDSPAPEDGPEPEGPSTGEMMEAILEGDEPKSPPVAKSKPAASAATTQYFEGASAIEAPKPKPTPPEPTRQASAATTQLFDRESTRKKLAPASEPPPFVADDEVPYGFEALALDDDVAPPSAAVTTPSLRVAPATEETDENAIPSFDDLAYAPEPLPSVAASEPKALVSEEDVPVVEASVVDGEDPGLPMLDPEAVAEAPPPATGGMEALAGSDPFSGEGGGFSFDAIAFESDDPVTSPKAPEPQRKPPTPPQDDADLDMDGLGNLFGSD